MVVDVRDLKAGYGTKAVVSLAALQIEKSEHTLLLGPSGCGKTTLLNVLAGIAAPLAGQVVINGTALETLSVGDRDRFRGKHIGLVMQRLHLISALTINKNLRLAQQLAGISVNDSIILGALEKLRRSATKPGSSLTLPMSDGRKSAAVKIQAQDKETIRTPAGVFTTVRHEAMLFNGVLFRRKAKLFIWLTDDARRLPVQIRVQMPFYIGSVTLQLEREEPG